jgi:hypothetical protein
MGGAQAKPVSRRLDWRRSPTRSLNYLRRRISFLFCLSGNSTRRRLAVFPFLAAWVPNENTPDFLEECWIVARAVVRFVVRHQPRGPKPARKVFCQCAWIVFRVRLVQFLDRAQPYH